jgi:hypothetical protein
MKPTPPDYEEPERTEREVSVDEFRAAALNAGWQLKTINLLTKDQPPRGYVGVGSEFLRIVN